MINNPFSDLYAEPIIIDNSLEPFSDNEFIILEDEGKSVEFPERVEVPLITSLPPRSLHGSTTSFSTLGSTQPVPQRLLKPIEWSAADLDYLVSCLDPGLALRNQFVFKPVLCSLQDASAPVELELYVRIPEQTIPVEAFSRDAPIGTGRPVSKVLIAESTGFCSSAAAARKSLANALLIAEYSAVNHAAIKYQVMAAVYSQSPVELQSILKTIVAMAEVTDEEWYTRLEQLRIVDHSWDLSARLESFLLRSGIYELGEWYRTVEVALDLSDDDKEKWSWVYAEASTFLMEAMSGI